MTSTLETPKKMIIFGCTYIGIQIATELHPLHQITLCDNNEQQVNKAKKEQLSAVLIDHTDDDKLKQLGIGHNIDIIFMAFEADSANVFVTLSARFLDQNLHIIALANHENAKNSLIAAGCNRVIKPYEMIGREIYNLIDRPQAMNVFSSVIYGESQLTLIELPLSKKSHYIGQLLQKIKINQAFNILLIGVINHQDQQFIYSQSNSLYSLKAADILMLMGEKEDIQKFQLFLDN